MNSLSYKLQKIVYFVLIAIFLFSTQSISASHYVENLEIDRNEGSVYSKSENIVISGNIIEQKKATVSIIDPNGIVVWAEPISVPLNGHFTVVVEAGLSNWYTNGVYEIKLESGDSSKTTFFFYDSGQQVNPPSVVDEFYVSESDLYLTFSIAIAVVIGVFLFLARCSIFKRKTRYEAQEFESQKNRDYEKYHSDWLSEEVFGDKTKNTSEATKEFSELFKEKSLPNYYTVLGLGSDATSEEIKTSYRKLAKEWHPDRKKMNSEKKMAEINQAYETLSDEKLRKEYDKFYRLL